MKRITQKLEALLLLGPTGSGKTPLGEWLETHGLRGRRCHHFDFGANLRTIAQGENTGEFTAAEIQFLRRVLEEGALLETERLPLAVRILDEFIARKGVQAADLLVLNGLPRHREQASALEEKVTVIGMVELECDARTVFERLRRNSGGDRVRRADDSEALVARKLQIYEARTRPLVRHYCDKGSCVLKVRVGVETQPDEIGRRLEDWGMEAISSTV